MAQKKNIALIFGGNNSEHEVSLSSSGQVAQVIDVDKYNIIYIAILKNGHWIIGDKAREYLKNKNDEEILEQDDIAEFVAMVKNKKIDLVLPILHGAYGEDGRLQGFLDIMDMPYVFSGHDAHALGMNKAKSKVIVAEQGVPTIPGQALVRDEEFSDEEIVENIGLPLFVKPNDAGSSVGISKVEKSENLERALNDAFNFSNKAVVEKAIEGRELTVGIVETGVDQKVLPVVEIIPQTSSWYDYEAKYAEGGSEHVCPAEIPADVTQKVQQYALTAFNAVGCKDLARVDFLWDEENDQLYFLEINTIPGMTSTSLVPDAARTDGISFEDLVNDLIAQNL